jgi:hypothetical protein
MTVVGVEREVRARPRLDEAEQIKRLIEIQTQIVELAKQNEIAERECEALRRELAASMRHSQPGRAPFARRFVELLRRLIRVIPGTSHAQSH